MSNPYEAPTGKDPRDLNKPLPPAQPPGLVSQVRVVAILMMIQGVFELLFAIYLGVFGLFFGGMMGQMMREDPNFQRGGGPPPEFVEAMMTYMPVAMGVGGLLAGILHCYAGYRNFQFSSRTLGIVALVSGLLTISTFYCCPTAFALFIYGLIIYMNDQVAKAFEMTAEGYPPDAILATFSRYRYEQEMSATNEDKGPGKP